MEVRSQTLEMGVVELSFTIEAAGETVPGILWSPEAASGPRPVVLIGHGATQHKRVANVLALARRFVRHLGFSAAALDAPDHGERVVDREAAERRRRELQEQLAAGPGERPRPVDAGEAEAWVERTRRGVLEWKALLDDLPVGNGRYGYWGLSMGTAIGLPLVATEPRIAAAVLGLAGLDDRPGAQERGDMARSLRVPVLLVEQWDDELVPRDAALALFDAIGSPDKALHLHPGGHVGTPLYERDAYDVFFARHLGS